MVELLAPVGKIENAYAAIENGANALFIGGKSFNARHFAENFTDDELEKIVAYAKLRDVQVHVTVNIIIKESETENLLRYLYYLSDLGVDAIIVQDFAVVALVKKHLPHMILHASTQLSAHSIQDVLFLKEIGFDRVVLARELQLKDIKAIIAACDIEVETFIHGALCYSYSGQCLMSSLIGGRSGNRGRCAQPCRMKYTLLEDDNPITEDAYLLSLKDICTVEHIPELVAAGITSFKIEGRMKSPEYVASVVKTYRKYIDLAQAQKTCTVDHEDIETMEYIFNRGGFSKGYYYQKAGKEMITQDSPKHIGVRVGKVVQFVAKTSMATIMLEGVLNPGDGIEIIRQGKESVGAGISKHYNVGDTLFLKFDKFVEPGSIVYLTKNHQLIKALKTTYQKAQRKLPITLKIRGKIDEPIAIQMSYKDKHIHYEGEILTKASNAPITKDHALKQLTKLGSTSFVAGEVDIQWEEMAYIPVSQLNEIRRSAVELFENALLTSQKAKVIKEEGFVAQEVQNNRIQDNEKKWTAHVTTLSQLAECLKQEAIQIIYWEWQYDNTLSMKAYDLCQKAGRKFYLALPAIMRNKIYSQYAKDLLIWEDTLCEGYLIRTYGAFYLLKESSKKITIDHHFNVMNNEAIALWHQLGADVITLSMETVQKESEHLEGTLERVVYGYIPLMTTEQCLLAHSNKCKKTKASTGTFKLRDRKQMEWPIQTDCVACQMQILTEEPFVMPQIEQVKKIKRYHLRLQFTGETAEETKKVLENYLCIKNKGIQSIKGVSFKPME